MRAICGLCLSTILVAGCAGAPEDGDRPFVIGNGKQVASLWWRGELTDTRGNLWNVAVIPGVATSLEAGVEGWKDALDFASEPAEREFWGDRRDDFGDGLEFAGEDVLHDFLAKGLSEDFKGAREGVASNVRETPFGWIPRAIAHAAWGFVLKPVGRMALTPIGVAGGLAWSVVTPTVHVVARPTGGVAWAVLAGTAQPVARLALHPPAFGLALVNREPAVRHDGSFGLEIIDGPDSQLNAEPEWTEPQPPAPRPFAELVAEQQAVVLAKLEEQDRAALDAQLAQRRNALITGTLSDDPSAWRASWEAWLAEVDPEGRAGEERDFVRLLLRHAEQR